MNPSQNQQPVADASADNWVDRFAPTATKPYLRLMRADRPIGVWLLLWPCWWSTALAALNRGDVIPDIGLLFLFALGAFVMRGAGCTYNDIVDKDIDAKVARTRSRPLPSGALSVNNAKILLVGLCFAGLAVLLQLNMFAVWLGIASLLPVAIYPFMKRLIAWPQLFLGLAFSWGALMGWAAVYGSLALAPLLLYLCAVSWTVGYDTIYAHQDKEDDALLGLGSTALSFGDNTKTALTIMYLLTILCLAAAGYLAGGGVIFFAGLLAGAAHLGWQVKTLDVDDAQNCLVRFRANRDFGAIIFIAIVIDGMARAAL